MGEHHLPITFDATTNVAALSGVAHVFHCHFYNTALHKAVEEGLGDLAVAVLERQAARVVKPQLAVLSAAGDAFGRAEALFKLLGFGQLDLSRLTREGGSATIHASHYALGWLSVHGPRSTPVCSFPAGFIAAAASVAFGLELDAVRCTETRCVAVAGDVCQLEVEVQS